MTAMFVVIFMEQWLKEKDHTSSVLGLVISVLCLIAFGADNFIIPAMLAILAVLSLLRRPLEADGTAEDSREKGGRGRAGSGKGGSGREGALGKSGDRVIQTGGIERGGDAQ